jgi:hypothetical protein
LIKLDFNFGTIPTEPLPKGKTTTSLFGNAPNNMTHINNTTMIDTSLMQN